MLISISRLKEFFPKPNGILQLGAYDGGESEAWKEWGCDNIVYVEPNPFLFQQLVKKVGLENCYQLAVYDKDDLELEMNLVFSKDRTNLGCSSLLDPSPILLQNPYLERCGKIKIQTTTLEKLLTKHPNVDTLILDVEGLELICLKGAGLLLKSIKAILTEFTLKTRYRGDCLLSDLDKFLAPLGFDRVITEFATPEKSWGDGLFIRSHIL